VAFCFFTPDHCGLGLTLRCHSMPILISVNTAMIAMKNLSSGHCSTP
jgi:hypothetical protein